MSRTTTQKGVAVQASTLTIDALGDRPRRSAEGAAEGNQGTNRVWRTGRSAEGAAEGSQGQARSAQPLDRITDYVQARRADRHGARNVSIARSGLTRLFLLDPVAACAATRCPCHWLPSAAPSALVCDRRALHCGRAFGDRICGPIGFAMDPRTHPSGPEGR